MCFLIFIFIRACHTATGADKLLIPTQLRYLQYVDYLIHKRVPSTASIRLGS
jgi:hypothetical protein